jgi:hypothetical protein
MASFDSVSFSQKLDGMWSVPTDYELANTDHHIPGSGDNVNISTGLLTRTVDVPFGGVTTSTKDTLVGKIGVTASLVWHEGTSTARLVGIIGLKKHSTLDEWRGALRVKI